MAGGHGGGFNFVQKRTKSQWIGRARIKGTQEWHRLVASSISFLGLQIVWSTEMAYVSPYLLSLGMSKSWMSIVFLAGPLSGLLVQPLIGIYADRCTSSLGRRRPFIIGGGAVCVLSLLLLGFTKEVAAIFFSVGSTTHTNLTILLAVFSVYALDFSINIVQAADRALLVDVLPSSLQKDGNAWASRLTGLGAVLGFFIGEEDLVDTFGWLADSQLKILSIIAVTVFCASHAITCFCVEERVLIGQVEIEPDDHIRLPRQQSGVLSPFYQIWNSWKTLPVDIKTICRIQGFSWIGWFPVLFYSSTWVEEIFVRNALLNHVGDEERQKLLDEGTRTGSRAMLYHAILAFIVSIILPTIVSTPELQDVPSSALALRPTLRDYSNQPLSPVQRFVLAIKEKIAQKDFTLSWLDLPMTWLISNAFFSLLMISSFFAYSVSYAIFVVTLTGFSLAISMWAPFALIGEIIHKASTHPKQTQLEELSNGQYSRWASSLTPISESTEPPTGNTDWEDERSGLITGGPYPGDGYEPRTGASDVIFDIDDDDIKKGLQATRENGQSPLSDTTEDLTPTMSLPNQPYSTSTRPKHVPPPINTTLLNLSSSSIPAIVISPHYDALSPPMTSEIQSEVLKIRDDDSLDFDSREREELQLALRQNVSRDDLDSEGEGDAADSAGVILGIHNIFIVLPQFLVTFMSSIIFAILSPGQSVLGVKDSSTDATTNENLTMRQEDTVEVDPNEWDAIGVVFRIGGIATAFAAYFCWKLRKSIRNAQSHEGYQPMFSGQ